ncbi:MAG: M15 family metallopeptidase [bacterium]|nr:M15 family metallopeptidase [bacterium]
MKKVLARETSTAYVASIAVIIMLVGSGAAYFYYSLFTELARTRSEFAVATSTLEHNIAELIEKLTAAEMENNALYAALHDEVVKNDEYGKQVESLVSTVTMLDKLSKTDRELLQKYSNVYFLSENYVPSSLATIDAEDSYRKDVTHQIHTEIKPKIQKLIDDSAAQGSPIVVFSAYRSFGEQAGLKAKYSVTYGKGTANSFSADQGYSEHQLGSAVDFTTPAGGGALELFEKSPSFAWLKAHAHEYGFILSYPKGNQYFVSEPWHWRFVGVELATKLHNENKSFYDLDQREINTYLVKIFD